MAIDKVREHLREYKIDSKIMEFETSSATVELAAAALGVLPARIAKTLCFQCGTGAMLIVTAGDVRLDNAKFKGEFGFKAKMLSPNDTFDFTGHEVGGVCPFGLSNPIPVYLDISMQRFETVYPACGSNNSAIELTCDELFLYSSAAEWVDVCK